MVHNTFRYENVFNQISSSIFNLIEKEKTVSFDLVEFCLISVRTAANSIRSQCARSCLNVNDK